MIAHALFNSEPLDADKMYEEYAEASGKIAPFVCDTASLLNKAISSRRLRRVRGCAGHHARYRSRHLSVCDFFERDFGRRGHRHGVAPTAIDTVIGVTKAYCTRVGGGPFPTEELGANGDMLRKRGNEFGAVTGRPRRCGWIDLPLLRYAGMINGISWLVVTKLDVLDELAEIPVCVGYKINGKETDEAPAQDSGYAEIKCVYRKMPGWRTATQGITELEKLPKAAREYLAFIEKESGARIGMVSTGPGREETIFVDDFAAKLQELTGSKTRAQAKI